MAVAFSEIIKALEEVGVTIRASHISDDVAYVEYRNLISPDIPTHPLIKQDAYENGIIYVGLAGDFRTDAVLGGAGFVFFGGGGDLPDVGESTEFVLVGAQFRTQVEKVLDGLFFSPSALAAYRHLTSHLVSENGLQHLVDLYSELLQNPIIVCDGLSYEWAIFSSTFVADTADIRSIIAYRELPEGYVDSLAQTGLDKAAFEWSKPILMDQGDYREIPRIYKSIMVDGKMVGVVTLVAQNRPFRAGDIDDVYRLTMAITDEIRRHGIPLDAMQDQRLRNLLKGDETQSVLIADWVGDVGCGSRTTVRLLLLRADAGAAYRLETRVRRHFQASSSMIARVDDDIALITRSATKELDETLLVDVESWLEAVSAHAAASTFITDAAELPRLFPVLGTVLGMGLKHEPERRLYRLEEYSTRIILDAASRSVSLAALVSPQVRLLKEYDAKHSSQYLETLSTYASLRSRTATAAALFIQKNTLDYRLARIKELLGMDSFSTQFLESVQISSAVERYLELL